MKLGRIKISNLSCRSVREASFIGLLSYLLLLPLRLIFKPNDHEGYIEIMNNISSSGMSPDMVGKAWVALFYLKINTIIPYEIMTNLLLIVYLVIFSLHAKNYTTILFHLVFIAPLSPYFGYITKEAMLLMILIFSYFVNLKKPEYLSITLFSLLALFSILIRQYYLPFIILSILALRIRYIYFFLFFILALIILVIFDSDVFKILYEVKKDMWTRLYYNSSVNTIFSLEFSSTGSFLDVIFIWILNVYFIVFTFIYHFGLVGFASIFNLLAIFVFFKSTKRNSRLEIWLFGAFSLLFMSYLVPDSGTFVRHSTMLTLFAIFAKILAPLGSKTHGY